MNIRINRVRSIGARRNNRRIYFNLARDSFRKIKRKRKEAARQAALQQSEQGGLGSEFFITGLKLGSKILGSEIGKKIMNKGIDNIPNIGTSKIKNKTINNALNSEIADLVVNEAQSRARKKIR